MYVSFSVTWDVFMSITATSGLGLLFPFSKSPGGTYSSRVLTNLINLVMAIITYQRREQVCSKTSANVTVFESVCLSASVVF